MHKITMSRLSEEHESPARLKNREPITGKPAFQQNMLMYVCEDDNQEKSTEKQ